MSAAPRVVITGMGVVSPIGIGLDKFWAALRDGRDGIGPITRFATEGFTFTDAGEVSDFPGMESPDRDMDLSTRFALAACRESVAMSGLAGCASPLQHAALVLATNFGGVSGIERLLGAADDGTGIDFCRYGFQSSADAVAAALQLGGPRASLSLSCSSGVAAMGVGMQWIRAARATVAVVGGFDGLSRFAWSGLSALRTMTRNKMRPFDSRRDGTIFSEGAGALVLENIEHARARGADILAEVCGHGLNNNAYHLTAPSKDSSGTADVMRMALKDSNIPADEVDHINAHGTATTHNDAAEAAAIHDVFGPRATTLPVTSNKAATGHMMGAAGSVEAIASVMTIRDGVVPPTLHCDEPDTACAIDVVRGSARKMDVKTVLCNSAGIGGTNAAVVLRRAPTS